MMTMKLKMKITKRAFVEHRSVSGFELGPNVAPGVPRILAPGACSCTTCSSCSAAQVGGRGF
jgi:hypothetical protein